MQEEAKGLPVAGYKATQPQEAIAIVNRFKELEERVLRQLDALQLNVEHPDNPVSIDQRFLAIGRTQLQQAFMAINRAVFQPGRVRLPEDDNTSANAAASAMASMRKT